MKRRMRRAQSSEDARDGPSLQPAHPNSFWLRTACLWMCDAVPSERKTYAAQDPSMPHHARTCKRLVHRSKLAATKPPNQRTDHRAFASVLPPAAAMQAFPRKLHAARDVSLQGSCLHITAIRWRFEPCTWHSPHIFRGHMQHRKVWAGSPQLSANGGLLTSTQQDLPTKRRWPSQATANYAGRGKPGLPVRVASTVAGAERNNAFQCVAHERQSSRPPSSYP